MNSRGFEKFQDTIRAASPVAELEAIGFGIDAMGGGCSALCRYNPGETVFVITEADGVSVPAAGEKALLGYYSKTEWDEGGHVAGFGYREFADLGAALAFVRAHDAALAEADLDKAIAPIQDAIGQPDGGIAGLYFSGSNDAAWIAGDADTRSKLLAGYLQQENEPCPF